MNSWTHMYWSGKKTFSYDHKLDKWDLDEPELNLGRSDHAVGIVTDEVTMEKYIIITGGAYSYIDDIIILKSTEVLLANSWSKGKNTNSQKLNRN